MLPGGVNNPVPSLARPNSISPPHFGHGALRISSLRLMTLPPIQLSLPVLAAQSPRNLQGPAHLPCAVSKHAQPQSSRKFQNHKGEYRKHALGAHTLQRAQSPSPAGLVSCTSAGARDGKKNNYNVCHLLNTETLVYLPNKL